MLTGSCLCRAIRYEVTIPITELRQCHCTDCQKVSGAGGTVNALIPSSAFRITRGEPKRFTKLADSVRTLHLLLRRVRLAAFQPARAHAGHYGVAHRRPR